MGKTSKLEGFSAHAQERCAERGVPTAQVHRTVTTRRAVTQQDGRLRFQDGSGLTVITDSTGSRVITVFRSPRKQVARRNAGVSRHRDDRFSGRLAGAR